LRFRLNSFFFIASVRETASIIMPQRVVEDLAVVVPTGRAFFGGGLDNPDAAGQAERHSGKMKSVERRRHNRASRRQASFPVPSASSAAGAATTARSREHPSDPIPGDPSPPPMMAVPANSPEVFIPPGAPTIGTLLGAMSVGDPGSGPISTRTRLRKRLGFPTRPPGNALEPSADPDDSRRMQSMSLAAARQRGKADAFDSAARARRGRDHRIGAIDMTVAGESGIEHWDRPLHAEAAEAEAHKEETAAMEAEEPEACGEAAVAPPLNWELAIDDSRRTRRAIKGAVRRAKAGGKGRLASLPRRF
jgi:hypothetical protein